jgi:hypothetical protein
MRVELRALKPNPFRNFKVDPIDEQVVADLKDSIKDNPAGFWGGIVARRHNGEIQLAFGHHRVKAALAAGIREDDIKVVSDISDSDMIRMYANENATQRGNSGTAIAGSVASAVHFIAKALLTGLTPDFRSDLDLEKARRHLTGEAGLGEPLVTEFLADIPGINKNTVMQQLSNIKASGDYDKIIEAVKAEIEEENREALKALKAQEEIQRKAAEAQALAAQRAKEAEERRKEAARAERAAKEEKAKRDAAKAQADAELAAKRAEEEAKLAAKRKEEADKKLAEFNGLRKTRDDLDKASGVEREVTFDFEGVAKHLKNASQIDHFREMVTGEGIRPYLAVNRQAALAKQLVAQLAVINKERERDGKPKMDLSARFIRENVESLVLDVKVSQRRFSAEEKARIEKQSWNTRFENHQREFSRSAHGLFAAALALSDDAKKRPRGVTLHMTSEFREAVGKLERAVALMKKAGVL